jgi:hypothetical protein
MSEATLFPDLLERPRLVAAATRELNFRLRVYPRWVEARRMTQARADEEIQLMRDIIRVLRGAG